MNDKQVLSSELEPRWVRRWMYPAAFVSAIVASYILAACGGGGDSGPCPAGTYEAEVGIEYDYTVTPMRVLPITACVPDGFDPWGHPLPKQ